MREGLSPNLLADYGYNFIQTALYTGYSEKFIIAIITESLKYNLNVNHVDIDENTIMHTAIYSDDYLGGLDQIFELLCKNGYDCTKVCSEGRNLLDAMKYMHSKYSKRTIESFEKKFKEEYDKKENCTEIPSSISNASVNKALSYDDILELEKYGKVLNEKKYIVSPTIGREKELKNLMITLAQDKKRPLIVGESGVGKTAIVDELAYRIKIGQVPSFLQGKVILEISPTDVVAGCKYVGMFEENITKLLNLCNKLDVIIFIDKAFAIAKFYDSEFITEKHFIEGFEYCDRIYESAKDQAIARLNDLDTSISTETPKILKIDFSRFKK